MLFIVSSSRSPSQPHGSVAGIRFHRIYVGTCLGAWGEDVCYSILTHSRCVSHVSRLAPALCSPPSLPHLCKGDFVELAGSVINYTKINRVNILPG